MTREEFIDKLYDTAFDLMHRWSPSNTSSDWECVFCDERPLTNIGRIEHKPDCFGNEIVKFCDKERF